jgi:hypothetical protein
MLPRIDRREVIREDEDGEWICPKGEEVLQMAGVLMIEEYVNSEARDDHEIHKMRNIYGKCKSSRKIDSNLLWLDYNHYSNDAAEAPMSQAPDGKNPPCMPPASTHTQARMSCLLTIVAMSVHYHCVTDLLLRASPSQQFLLA